jgi:Cu2+-exporting ATPase
VAVGGKLAGIIAIHDPLRAEAPGFIQKLRESGIKHIIMLTGDNAAAAREAARKLGITEYVAESYPEAKLEVIKEWQRKGHIVAMVGDGINDSPALSHADVGISMRHGADIAKEASDMLLMEGKLEDIFLARKLAVETLETIHKNYKAIIGLNSTAILMAITGRVPPIFSAVVHNLSTVGVSLVAMKPLRRKASPSLPKSS